MLRDAVKQITNTWKILIQQNRQNTYRTFIWIISMAGQCVFIWLKNVNDFDINSSSEKSSLGYILEVDLKNPDELHLVHND